MKKIQWIVAGCFQTLLCCGLMTSCSDEDLFSPNIQEGLPVSLKFTLSTPKPNEVKVTRATDEQETRVEKLALFFYSSNGQPAFAYNVPATDMKQTTGQGTSTNYLYEITIPETAGLKSGTYQLYAVANWDYGFWDNSITFDQLAAKTKTEMDAYCVKKTGQGTDISETAILLSGKYGRGDGTLTLQRTPATGTAAETGENVLTDAIHLRRSISKNLFYFLNGEGVTFTPETYEIHNYCQTATLMERDGWQLKSGTTDNVSGTHPGALGWMGETSTTTAPNFINFLDRPVATIDVTAGTVTEKKPGFMFYMPENVQKPKASLAENIKREAKNQDGKFTYASDQATYVVVHGKYHGPKGGTGTDAQKIVDADVHYTILLGDFSKSTGKADNFTVRRNTKYTYKVTVKGVNNIIVEATSQTENQPGAEGDVVHSGTDNVKRLDAHYETCLLKFDETAVNGKNQFGFVLRSPKGHEVIKNSNEITDWSALDVNWIHFMKPASATTYASYPGNSGVISLKQLLESFKNNTYLQYCVKDAATGKLCIQAFVDEYFYADLPLSQFVNVADRQITLATGTSVSTDGNSTYTDTPIFSVQQRSIKSMFSLDATNPFGLESTDYGQEDVTATGEVVLLGIPQGSDNKSADLNNGFQNTLDNITIGDRWDKYIDIATGTLKSTYNTGIYQFLLRNRDENGDGIIQKNEIKWYMPAVNQCNAIWAGYFALTDEARWKKKLYFTSTSGMFRTYWAQEGAFGAYKTTDDNGYNVVRCIRALRMVDGATTHISQFDPSANTYNVKVLGANALRMTPQRGEYHFHSQHDRSNRLPQAFKMAKTDLIYNKPSSPGDSYIPVVTTKITNTQNGGFWATSKITFDVTITREPGRRYFWAKTLDGVQEEIIGNTLPGQTVVKEDKNIGDPGQDVRFYIFAENGNYVEFFTLDQSNPPLKTNEVILDENKPVQSGLKQDFTRADIAGLTEWCKEYSEEPDGSDRGQWRIPNQRELMLMFMHSTGGKGTGGYTLSDFVCAHTYNDGRNTPQEGIYFVQKGGDFITTDSEGNSFKIRPVRDVSPSTVTNQQSDASMQSGGSIIKSRKHSKNRIHSRR